MKEAVLQIYYTDKNKKLHVEPQGKFFYQNNKPFYLADMNEKKWWRNYGGYSIAKQLLEAFSKVKAKPQIIYRVKERATLYLATATTFIKKGVFVSFGGHEQFILSIKYFKAVSSTLTQEPKDLPIIDLNNWVKTSPEQTSFYIESVPIAPIQERLFT